MTTCPVCNKPVDPIRSRFVAVRGGKVVPYCSPECRDSQDSKPVIVQLPKVEEAPPKPKAKTPPIGVPKSKTPAAGIPKSAADLDSGPVIEIVHEPASGVVTSAKDERVTQPTGKFAKEELVEVKETIKPRTDTSKTSGGADKASVAGEVNDTSAVRKRASRTSGKHLTRERKDSTEAKAGWDWLEDEPADAERTRPGTITEGERRARWPFIMLLVIVVLGGGGYLVMKYVIKGVLEAETKGKGGNRVTGSSDPAHGVPQTPAVDAPTAIVEADAAVLTKDAALRQATDLLRKYIQDGSPRVQRLAAGALGRTGDPAAVAALQQAVKAEKVNAARFKVAYELARAGEKGGRDALVTGLSAPERSDKLDAAAKLAQLGDDRAKPLLSSLLTMEQHKLRAAEELARLKDPAAGKLLEQVRSNAKSSADEKATATIALFRNGHTELHADVKKLLENDSWKAFAAYALGEAKDDTAKPFLVEQIKTTVGVKVRAAFALRKLGGDQTDEVLPTLVALLGSQKDQEQIAAAEAILILAGEPQWSEYQ